MEKEKRVKEKRRGKWLSFFEQGKGLTKKAISYFSQTVSGVSTAFWELVEEDLPRERSLGKRLLMPGVFLALALFSGVVSLARFPLDTYPAGFALLSAVGGTGRIRVRRTQEKNGSILEAALLLTVFSGVLLSCIMLGKKGIFYLLAYMILFLLRAGLSGGKFDDSILFRVTLSSAFATGLSLLLAVPHFSVNQVFGAVSMGLLTPILTYLLCGIYIFSVVKTGREQIQSRRRVYLEASVFTLFYLFLFALREVVLFQFSLSLILTVMAMLFLARFRGPLFGAAAGMIGGMACAMEAVAPALAVGGFFAGLFFEYSGTVAMMISFVASCGYSLFSEGFSSFAFVSADYLCALVLFWPFLGFVPKENKAAIKQAPREVMHRETMRRARQKLKSMSDAFSSLSEVFYTVGNTMKKPQLTETSQMVSDCCSQVCSHCALSALCWGEEQSLSACATTAAATRLLSEGKVSPADFPPPFSSKCRELEPLVEKINRRFEEINGNYIKNNKTRLLAGEYSSVSRLLKSTALDLGQELEYNLAFEARAKKVLGELGIGYRRVAVFGKRELKIDVYGVAMERVSLNSDQVVEAFGKEFDCLFDAPAFLMFEENVVMRLRRRRKIALECAKSGCTKKGEAVSGDSCQFFETERDFFYTLICDGMGSGRDAAFTSRLSSIFIEKLMHCATPKNVTLEMLNAFLMAKTDETFTTVDLLEVDLLSGDANFIKAGAAPSYVLRGDRLHCIESRTPPAGALVRMCAEQTSFFLKEGDFIIQMSDGAEVAGEGSGWLIRLLTGQSFQNAAALCDCIFRTAREKGAFRDDLSISVVRIMNSK